MAQPWSALQLPAGWAALLNAPPPVAPLPAALPPAALPPPALPLLDSMACPVVLKHHVGVMDVACPHCSALFFRGEPAHCCSNGAVDLPHWRVPPEPLLSLLQEPDFRLRIRGYNCALSLGSSVFTDMTKQSGPATFTMAGRSWRLLPASALPHVPGTHKTAQVYTLPVDEATNRRVVLTSHSQRSSLRRDWLSTLHTMLLQHNALVRSFQLSCCDGQEWNISVGVIDPHATASNDTMVGLLIGGGGDRATTVVPFSGGGSLVIVPDLDPYYQPLHYVLLFPHGEPQWGLHLSRGVADRRKRKRALPPVTIFDYLKFLVQRRGGTVSIHDYGRLFEEWFVDCFLQSENQKLRYLKFNQSKFRREHLGALHRQLHAAVPPRQIGSPATHLPSSFVRGYRYFRELYADAMTLPAEYGGIDYFVTFTTNPSWPEIVENARIKDGMNSPDLYCRVFHLKMRALLQDIVENGVLGVVVAFAWSVEFQQRGLPHMHAVFIVRPEDKPHSPAIVDRNVSAQLPDPETDLVYFTAVTKHMIHGPCGIRNPGHYCMKNGACRFDYPKRLQDATSIPADGYTALARPFGRSVVISPTFTADNSWVVPHNRYLLCRYDAHVNVEASASISVVKYMFSYIYKGSKTTTAGVCNGADEIQMFSDGRITSAAEAVWHVLGFNSHKQMPTVQRLGCGLPDDPVVMFDAAAHPDDIAEVGEQAVAAPSHLKSWFQLNSCDAFARTLLYCDIPKFYTWNETNRTWQRRKNKSKCLGRLYPVDPSSREAWSLRVLLLHCRGATSVSDIRTVNGEERSTFFEAAVAAGLYDDDAEYHKCLNSSILMPPAVRSLLLIILLHCQPRDPAALLHSFFEELTADWVGTHDQKEVQLLMFIANHVDVSLEELGLDIPPGQSQQFGMNTIFLESFVSNPASSHVVANLNDEQQTVHDAIMLDMTRVAGTPGTVFTLMAAAGTGKTYLINAILATARLRGLRVVPCATSGLAASLLGHARTGTVYDRACAIVIVSDVVVCVACHCTLCHTDCRSFTVQNSHRS